MMSRPMLKKRVLKQIQRLDRDEDGAILLAALAATMILFLLALTMYDAGNVTREKIKLQTATDAAAYSQAAIKARTMNANAYVNVTKRSIVGLHLTYYSAFNNYYQYTLAIRYACQSGQLAQTGPECTAIVTPRSCTDPDASSGGACIPTGQKCCDIHIAIKEQKADAKHSSTLYDNVGYGGYSDTTKDIRICRVTFDPNDPDAPVTCQDQNYGLGSRYRGLYMAAHTENKESNEPARFYGGLDKFHKELRQLTRYQEYMQVITPWWAFSEALGRASLNGATMATAYPPPPNLTPAGAGNYPNGASPNSNMDFDWSFNNIPNTLNSNKPVGLAAQFGTQRGNMCSQFALNPSSGDLVDPLFERELNIHMKTLKNESTQGIFTGNPGTGPGFDFSTSVLMTDGLSQSIKMLGGYTLCNMGQTGYLSTRTTASGNTRIHSSHDDDYNNNNFPGARPPIFDSAISAPYLLTTNPKNSAASVRDLSQMRMSNIVFGYYQGSDFTPQEGGTGPGMTRFDFMTQNYATSLPANAKGSGIWTMARGEIVTQQTTDGDWHASWTARVRPISREDELANVENALGVPSGSFLYNAYLQALPYLEVNNSIGHASGTADHHPEVWQQESNTMERATRAMGSSAAQGFTK